MVLTGVGLDRDPTDAVVVDQLAIVVPEHVLRRVQALKAN